MYHRMHLAGMNVPQYLAGMNVPQYANQGDKCGMCYLQSVAGHDLSQSFEGQAHEVPKFKTPSMYLKIRHILLPFQPFLLLHILLPNW